MIITQDVKLMVILLQALNASTPTRLEDIANRRSVSQHFLEQLARKLRLAGYIKSIRGPGGGYVLAPNIQVSLLNLMACKKAIKRPKTELDRLVARKLAEINIPLGAA